MSYSDLVNKAVNANVASFIARVASTYNLKADELTVMWSGEAVPVKSRAKAKPSNDTPAPSGGDSSVLNAMNKPELVAMCKSRSLKTTGTKAELVSRLSGEEIVVAPKSKSKETVAKPKTSTTKKEPAVAKTIQTSLEPLKITKNSHGNYEHAQSGLVVEVATKKVYGKQNANGKVDPLTDSDIETCKKYKMAFVLPENLNSKKNVIVEDEDENIVDEGEDEGEDVDEEFVDEEEEELDEGFVDEE